MFFCWYEKRSFHYRTDKNKIGTKIQDPEAPRHNEPEWGWMSRSGGSESCLIPPLLSCSCHPFAASLDISQRCRASVPLTATHRSSELILLLWQHDGDLGHAVTAPFSLLICLLFLQSLKVISTSPCSSLLLPPITPPASDLDIPR